MKLHRGLTRLFLLTGLAGVLSANVEGALIDKMCSMKAVKDGQEAATMHTLCHDARLREKRIRCLHGGQQVPRLRRRRK
jgi:hypothetical protein